MPGLASMALGAAPIFGGAFLMAAAGNLKGPDVRALIKLDLDLLDRIPPEQTRRRAELQRTIDERIDDLVVGADRRRAVQAAVASYEGNWRDVVLFGCAVLFSYVWWQVNHARADWLPMFCVLILAAVLSAGYALRGARRSLINLLHRT